MGMGLAALVVEALPEEEEGEAGEVGEAEPAEGLLELAGSEFGGEVGGEHEVQV